LQDLNPLIDNTGENLGDVYSKLARDSREIRISTGYFYVSGFNLVKEDLENLADPDDLGRAPLRILMGATSTDARTAEEIEEGMSLRERIRESVAKEIEDLNKPQIERLDNLKNFIADGKVKIRVHDPDQGIFHSKGACFRREEDGTGTATTIIGSSNFSKKGHTKNVELNVATEQRDIAEEFEDSEFPVRLLRVEAFVVFVSPIYRRLIPHVKLDIDSRTGQRYRLYSFPY
jgi:phosphatidylserine/phosphatidylglycerophosphate/cardiolipin synthase-like enzyme